MKIYHTEDGFISAVVADTEEGDGTFITIADDDLPEGFLQTFGLGAFRVNERGKIVQAKRKVTKKDEDDPLRRFLPLGEFDSDAS